MSTLCNQVSPSRRVPALAAALTLAGLACGLALARSGDEHALVVERFGVERGLFVDNVTALHQDSEGFLWIGTREGLLLYDGTSTTTFEHDIGDPDSIADNYVRTIFEDSRGRLWIGTNASGLERLDRSSWSFRHYRHDSSDPSSISHDSVNVIFEASDGTLWVGTQIGLNRFDPAAEAFERILADPGDPHALAHDYVYALAEDDAGRLWVGTVGGGLDRLDASTGRFAHHRHDPGDPASLPDDRVFALVKDHAGALWVGSDTGLARLDPRDGSVERIGAGEGALPGLSYPLVTGLALDGEGTLWIATWGGGVDRLEIATRRFLPPLSRELPSLARERSSALTVDRSGAIWIGTWSQGVVRARRPSVRASLVTSDEGLAFDDATAVMENAVGHLWVGTWGRGLSVRWAGEERFDPEAGELLGALGEGTVLALEDGGEEGVWAGTMGPLFRVSRAGRVRSWAHDPNDPASIGPGYVTALLVDRRGALWAGVGGSGLYRLREDGQGFDIFVHDPQDPATLSDNYVTSLVEDGKGTIWVGTRSGGLNALDPVSGLVTRHAPDPARGEGALSYHYVTSLAVDDAGRVWVGTAGGGLNLVEGQGSGARFVHYGEEEGLVDDTVRSLVPDGAALWIGTARGLARLDVASGDFYGFDEGDGLPTSGFNGNAAFAGSDALYFGTSEGLLVLPRGEPMRATEPAPTVLRSVRTVEGRAPLRGAPWKLDALEVRYGEILSFAFAVLDFRDPRRHRFAYRLGGLRDEWIELGDRRDITFTDLDPGRYILRVRGRNARGVWSESEQVLQITVVPPFWMTSWFRVAGLVLLVVAVYGAHKRRTETLKNRNRSLAALKDQREEALARMRESQDALSAAYERLRGLTRRLEQAKEDERKRIARELHDEMGQGLTAAKINLELIAAADDGVDASARAADTIELVDGMIQHVRTLSLDLRPPLLDELGLRPALRGYLEAQAQRSGLAIDISEIELPEDLPAEVAITAFRFVQEALTNVIRHAQARRVLVRAREEKGAVELRVRDDGRGFDLDQAMLRATGGHHLGLLGIRERVESLGGRLSIESEAGHGTTLDVSIPWR